MNEDRFTKLRRDGLWFIAVNFPFVLGHPSVPWTLPPLLRSLAINLILFLVPGLAAWGWRRLRNFPDPLTLLLWVMISFAMFFGGLAAFQAMGWPITAHGLWNTTWFLTNLLALVSLWNARQDTSEQAERVCGDVSASSCQHQRRSRWIAGGVLFFAAYGLYFHAANRIVPPQADHDLEVQGTGYGLIHRMEPLLLTDRGPHFYFAHPLLLHFYVGESFLYFDRLEQLKPYDDASRRMRAIREGQTVSQPIAEFGGPRITGQIGEDYVLESPQGSLVRLSAESVELERIDSHYALSPGRLETRTPSIFLAALTVALMGIWMAELSGQFGLGVLAAATYATSPEVYVRSSYGGYFAISKFLTLCMLLAAALWDENPKASRTKWACLLAGLFGGLANHKLILLPASLAVVTAFRRVCSREAGKPCVHPLFIGFALGTSLFWIHGFLIDADAFWKEHVRTHLIDRVMHHNPLGYKGYPTAIELWTEFSRHTGYVLLPLGVVAMLGSLAGKPPDDSLLMASRTHHAEGMPDRLTPFTLRAWLVWMLGASLVYSLVDWKMTKHLTPLFLPLFLVPAAWSASALWIRRVVTVTLLGLFVWNLAVLRTVIADFGALTITPAW